MRGTTIESDIEKIEFAKKAARDFSANPDHTTFGEIGRGEFMAIRWGMGGDCVLVLKQDEDFEPTNYHQLVKTVKP